MNKRQKEVLQYQFDSEKEVLDQLTKQYQRALNDIDRKIRILESDELTQSRIYRIEYQKVLKKQVEAVLEKLHSDEYTTIQQFLSDSYTNGFVGTAYDMHGQGVQLILPIDKNAAVKAVVTDSKISEGLYEALGVDTKKLKKTISSEITRGIAAGMPHSDIARNITSYAKAPLGRAKTIVRTEAHRISQASAYDAQKVAVSKGANVVKQWMSTLDGDTRPTHRRLDGQIREVDEPFEMGGMKAMYPGDFGDPAEDCNCRCQLLQRSRLAMDEEELNTLKQRAEFFGLDKSDDFEDFKEKYLKADNAIKHSTVDEIKNKYGEDIQFYLEGMDAKSQEEIKRTIKELSGQYNTSLKEVYYNPKLGALNGKEAGKVDSFYGYTMELKNSKVVEHEFCHTLTSSSRKKLAKKNNLDLELNEDFQKDADKLFKEYKKAVANDKSLRISEYSVTNVDEFFAEAFNVLHGGKPADPWGSGADSPFASMATEIIDKYFKKPLENAGKSGIIKEKDTAKGIGLQYFANKGILKQSDAHLKKSIASWSENIAEHKAKIADPRKFDSAWDAKSDAHKDGLIKHWKKEIQNFQNNINEAKDELDKRGQSK